MPRFVVHEHRAKNLHYDFRIELDGVLKSWAVPKEPPREAGTKRLAIQAEDHALSYMDFHGKIPEGRYGAGTVKIWDRGRFSLSSRKPEKLVFSLHGKKLRGEYVLLKFKDNWLFFKKSGIRKPFPAPRTGKSRRCISRCMPP